MIEVAVVATRWLLFSAVLVLFGASLFLRHGLPAVRAGGDVRWPARWLLALAAIALVASVSGLMAQTAALSGEGADAVRWTVLAAVISATHFGLLGALRTVVLALLVIQRLLPGESRAARGSRAPLAVSAVLAASFAWTGHGAMNGRWAGVVHLGADVLHLLAAGAWLGALVPLAILAVRARSGAANDARTLYEALERFSGIGPTVVGLLIATGLVNTWFLIGPGHWRALFTSGYGLTLCVKLALFALMLLLAAANRLRLVPRLGRVPGIAAAGADGCAPALAAQAGSDGAAALRTALQRLRASLLAETALALLVIAAVALLGTLEPPVSN